ncbi:virulence factor Mce family protein [Mycolicibacterium flavescens]|uniref:MCE family protein n=1 Tax=Mycobacterium neumannii TaxID=2048551 RepID=UPI000B93FF12|nr:MCE family protein [Mycobacterium neumannii]VEG43603.1 virulence factor Mce family protein [Mycolicibacterium flavescens]
MNIRRRRSAVYLLAAGLAVLLAAGSTLIVRQTFFAPKLITAYFTSATGIYPGDDVRVLGVKVGRIAAIEPAGAQVMMRLHVDGDIPIPADAKAVIVAQNLISARYVQLAPAYSSSGPALGDGAVIPAERTASPVEWDEVKTQLTKLATDLGPAIGTSDTSVSRFIDSAASAMHGNGEKLRNMLAELSGVGRILANGSGNVVEIIKNLQIFVTTLRDSSEQIVQFQNRFATLASVLNDDRSGLDAALADLSIAVSDIQRFVAGSRDQTVEQVQRLANVTQTLVDHQADLENVLHVTPNAIANAYNIYNPETGTQVGSFVMNNFSDPRGFICGAIGAVANVTAPVTSKLCNQYLGPALRLPNFNYLPIPFNPYLTKSPDNVIYSDPKLAPGGVGPLPGPAEQPPSVSAYTGFAENPFPAPGVDPSPAPRPSPPDHLAAIPSPALFPGAPIPAPPRIASTPQTGSPTLPQLLLPAEGTSP